MNRLKVIAVVGPTASGKSAWAVSLAKCFGGFVISADSRQVYKGLDIATTKITKAEMSGIPHYLLDVVSPTESFDVATYQKLAYELIKKFGGKKLPIIAGGTGLYVQAVTDGYVFPTAKPNWKLREKLEKQPLEKLVSQLKKLEPDIQIDFKNPRRVIRALEIYSQPNVHPTKHKTPFDTLKIGIKLSTAEQEKRIAKRIQQMDFNALTKETKRLIQKKFYFDSNPLTAFYYCLVKDWLEEKINKTELLEKMVRADRQYAKRQMTWFRKDPAIHWVDSLEEAKKLIKEFLADEAK